MTGRGLQKEERNRLGSRSTASHLSLNGLDIFLLSQSHGTHCILSIPDAKRLNIKTARKHSSGVTNLREKMKRDRGLKAVWQKILQGGGDRFQALSPVNKRREEELPVGREPRWKVMGYS